MGAFLGLLAGLGLLLIWRSGPRAPARRRPADLLVRTAAGTCSGRPAWTASGRRSCSAPRCSAPRSRSCSSSRSRRRSRSPAASRSSGSSCPRWSCGGCSGGGRARCASSGPRRSTTWRPPCGPACRCPRGFRRSRCAARPSCGRRSRRFATAYRATGRFGECLDALKDDLADPVGDRVCETMRVAREVGGSDLGTVLRTLSELLRADARTRSELETRQGWVINAARLAVAAPWAVLLLLGTQSQTLTRLRLARRRVAARHRRRRLRRGVPDHAAHRPPARRAAGVAMTTPRNRSAQDAPRFRGDPG